MDDAWAGHTGTGSWYTNTQSCEGTRDDKWKKRMIESWTAGYNMHSTLFSDIIHITANGTRHKTIPELGLHKICKIPHLCGEQNCPTAGGLHRPKYTWFPPYGLSSVWPSFAGNIDKWVGKISMKVHCSWWSPLLFVPPPSCNWKAWHRKMKRKNLVGEMERVEGGGQAQFH